MPQKFAFTTAAMAAALEETPVSYEDLADIERDFDDVETEIIRQQVALTAPLYERRERLVSKIENFWPLVLEQAPPDIDQYIQPSDSALLLSSLTSIYVSRFEIDQEDGDPRSVSIRWEFSPNEYFDDQSLEKKFWYRRARDGWSGLVSEPVRIQWKKDRDLTSGLLDMVCKAWEAEKSSKGNERAGGLLPEHKALSKQINNTGMGGLSFFAWFGFIGRKVSAEESAAATRLDREIRNAREAGTTPPESLDGDAEEEDDGVDELGMSLEIFPDGDELAVSITDDLWPAAIKYFTQAQEQDALSDADFESDGEEVEELAVPQVLEDATEDSSADTEDGGDRPAKKQRSA